MERILAQSGWLALPIVLAGLGHVAVIRLGWFADLARMPLDGGLRLRDRRLFGDNKTVRGALVMVTLCVVWTVVLEGMRRGLGLSDDLLIADSRRVPVALWGALLGIGYIAGELPNSFVKRQLEVAPGAPVGGRLRKVFWVVDQIDSLLGVLLFIGLAAAPPLAVVACLFVIALVVHPAVAAVMVGLGLKNRIG